MITTVVTVIIVAAAAFFGGMQYQKNQTASSIPNFANGQFSQNVQRQRGQNGQLGRRLGFSSGTIGEVVNVDSDSITVKLQDGSSKIVNLSGSTTYSKTDTASKSDIKVGQRIAAFGSSS